MQCPFCMHLFVYSFQFLLYSQEHENINKEATSEMPQDVEFAVGLKQLKIEKKHPFGTEFLFEKKRSN